jgi:DNA-binding IscR family transcriptional regulator
MRCVACGFENPADASFCGESAAPFASTLSCPSCGKANAAKQKFCNGCGRSLGGSTDRSASPDPRSYTPKHKIAGRMLLLDETLAEGLPVMFDFLGVSDPERPAPPLAPEARQRQLFDVIRRLGRARSAREPAVFLFEDLHWFDRASEEFIENLVEISPGNRTFVLLNFRPEFHARWMQRSYYQQLPLAPLSAEAIDALLRDLVGSDASVKALPELIRERTGGNPFFIEEVVQALVENGGLVGARGGYRLARPMERVAIPPTVQAVLAARIDRLESREKHLLQTAAVIGKEFAEPVLKRVTELTEAELPESLGKLAATEFIYEEALYPQAEYAFKHPLTQEVAYRSQLGERRSRTHAAVARAIEELYPGQLDGRAALLATDGVGTLLPGRGEARSGQSPRRTRTRQRSRGRCAAERRAPLRNGRAADAHASPARLRGCELRRRGGARTRGSVGDD